MFIVSKDQNSAVLLKEGRPPRRFVAKMSYHYCKGCSLFSFSPDIMREGMDAHCGANCAPARNRYCYRVFRADGAEIIWKEVAR